LFLVGILKCLFKPWDLKRVSINSLVDSSAGSCEENSSKIVISSLDEYVLRAATEYFHEDHPSDSAQVKLVEPYLLFVDLAPPYFERLKWLKALVHNPDRAYNCVRFCLSETFDRFYTKESVLFTIDNWLGLITYLRLLVTGVSFVIVTWEQGIRNHRHRHPCQDHTYLDLFCSCPGFLFTSFHAYCSNSCSNSSTTCQREMAR
jgi:hypothetical protein